MHIRSSGADGARKQRLLTFARSHDAQLYAVRTHLTSTETDRLRASLEQLIEIGALALFRIDTPIDVARTWEDAVACLREQLGRLFTDSAVAAAAYPATPTPKPQTLIPVWPFEQHPVDADTLTACGLFLGGPITFEALPVLDTDLTRPIPEIAARFDAWSSALDKDAILGTVALPGREKAYALFASVRAG